MSFGLFLRALPLALPLGLALAAGGAEAKTAPPENLQVLDCTFTNGDPNLIGDRLFILRDVATNEISVFDGVVKEVYKAPMKAKVRLDNANRLEIDWIVENVSFGTSKEQVSFHATLLKADMKIFEKSIVGAFENRESRDGTCKPMK